MTRRPTDLLDVFRSDRTAPGRTPSGGASAGGAASGKEPRPAKRPFEGLFLAPRQLLLGCAVVVLLLVFSFVLGLSAGRRSGGSGGASLARNEQRGAGDEAADETRVFVLARIPTVDKVRAIPNEPRALLRALVELRGVPAEKVWIREEAASSSWVVVLGPFNDRTKATEFLAQHSLGRAKIGGVYPFDAAEYRNLPVSGLPREHLPR